MILRRENFFSPERRSKVVKFAKNDRLDGQEMSNFYFSLENDPKGGPLDDFFSILGLDLEKANFQKTKVK